MGEAELDEADVRDIFAYLDGEMIPSRRRAFETRLETDSELAHQFSEVSAARSLWSTARVGERQLDRVHWRRLDSRILDAVERQERGGFDWPSLRWLVWAGVAAAVAFAAYTWRPQQATEPASPDAPAVAQHANEGPADIDVPSLKAGQQWAPASVQSVAFGRAKVTAQPGSRLVAQTNSKQMTRIELQAGTARFDVAPRQKGQRYEVVAGDVTVWVVGTAFEVKHTDGHLWVTVEHGTVRVEPTGRRSELLTRGMSTHVPPLSASAPTAEVRQPAKVPATDQPSAPAVAVAEQAPDMAVLPLPTSPAPDLAARKPRRSPKKRAPRRATKPAVATAEANEPLAPPADTPEVPTDDSPGEDVAPTPEAVPEVVPSPTASTTVRAAPIACRDEACQQLKRIFGELDANSPGRSIIALREWLAKHPDHRHRTAARYAIGYCEFKRGNRTAANRIFSERAMTRWIKNVKSFENPPKPR